MPSQFSEMMISTPLWVLKNGRQDRGTRTPESKTVRIGELPAHGWAVIASDYLQHRTWPQTLPLSLVSCVLPLGWSEILTSSMLPRTPRGLGFCWRAAFEGLGR